MVQERWGRLIAAIAFAPVFTAAIWLLGLEMLLRQRGGAGRGGVDPVEEAVVRAYRERIGSRGATPGGRGATRSIPSREAVPCAPLLP